jgi:hypothetical protein
LRSVDDNAVLVPEVRITVALPNGNKVEALLGMTPLVFGQSAECDLAIHAQDPRERERALPALHGVGWLGRMPWPRGTGERTDFADAIDPHPCAAPAIAAGSAT